MPNLDDVRVRAAIIQRLTGRVIPLAGLAEGRGSIPVRSTSHRAGVPAEFAVSGFTRYG